MASAALVVSFWVAVLVAWLQSGFLVAEGCMWEYMLWWEVVIVVSRRESVWAVGSVAEAWAEEATEEAVSLGSCNCIKRRWRGERL
jgi:hypothetical protein